MRDGYELLTYAWCLQCVCDDGYVKRGDECVNTGQLCVYMFTCMHIRACIHMFLMCVRVCVWCRDECVNAGQWCVCMFTCMHAYASHSMCLRVYVHACVCMHASTCLRAFMRMRPIPCVYVCVCVCV